MGIYEFALFILSFQTEVAVENVLYEIVPGQVRTTSPGITLGNDRSRICQSGPRQARSTSPEPTTVPAGRSPGIGVSGAPLKLKDPLEPPTDHRGIGIAVLKCIFNPYRVDIVEKSRNRIRPDITT